MPNYTIYRTPAHTTGFNGQWIPVYRPQAYNPDLKWETTTSWNFGIDFGFLNNRISGSVDFYTRETKRPPRHSARTRRRELQQDNALKRGQC